MIASSQLVAAALDETFAFFADAANLEAITPPFLSFDIVSPLPIAMREGALIEYRLRLMGAPVRWLTRIESWQPGRGFTDVQLTGPYACWIHHHTFVARTDGTEVHDRVEYALPLEPLSAPVHALFVRPTLERIFAYRRGVIAHVLGTPRKTWRSR
jgi:hypothetical protein